jgi:hypothetical protein
MQGLTGALKIAQLPVGVRLDSPWPMQKIALKATPHRITAVPDHSLYAMLVSKEVGDLVPFGVIIKSTPHRFTPIQSHTVSHARIQRGGVLLT